MKLAACLLPDAAAARDVVPAMLQAQALRPDHTTHVIPVDGGAIGFVSTSDRMSAVALHRRSPHGNVLLVSGVPIDLAGDLDRTLSTVASGDYRTAARLLPGLDGAFAAVFWDQHARALVVVTDFLGMQPLYTLRTSSGLILASEIKGLTASRLCAVDLDPTGWGLLLSVGYFAGDVTSVRGVARVEAATVMVHDTREGTTASSIYWHWPEPRPDVRVEDVDTQALVHHFERQVGAYLAHHRPGTVLLSGGFDSRLIACALAGQVERPKALILSRPLDDDDADARFGVRLARILGMEVVFATPSVEFYSSDAYLDYLIANEVATPSFPLFIAQLPAHISPVMAAVWDGLAPPFALQTPHQRPGGFGAFLKHECSPLDSRRWRAARRIFAPSVVTAMVEGFTQCIARARERYGEDVYAVAQFVTRSLMRNRTGPNPLKVYANDVLPFTPGLAKEFWGATASLPYDAKSRYRLYFEIFRRHYPHAYRVPFFSEGHLTSRPGLDTRYYVERVRSRVVGLPYVGGILRRAGLRSRLVRQESRIVDRTLLRVDPGHPDLAADGVEEVLRDDTGRDPLTRAAREWIFYWQIWRWVMDGTVRDRWEQL